MAKFRVGVTNTTVDSGVGPTLIEATDAENAKLVFAQREGTTLDQLAEAGLTWWTVEEAPSSGGDEV